MFKKSVFKQLLISALAALVVASSVLAVDLVPERRKEQFSTELGYLILPAPYSLPGIGSGLALTAGVNNIPFFSYETPTDLFAIKTIAGDIDSAVVIVKDLYLFPKFLSISYVNGVATKAAFRTYPKRGMGADNKADDFLISELADSKFEGATLHLEFFERRLSFFRIYFTGESKLKALRDNEAELIGEFSDDKAADKFISRVSSVLVDLTDDRADPRKGFRANYWRGDEVEQSDKDLSDGYKADINISGYIPLLTNSTLVLNYFRSDFFVTREGITDKDEALKKLKEELDCGASCDDEELEKQAEATAIENKHGRATALGGRERLRSYPGGRFSGGHSEFRAFEFRWNLTDENTPYDIWFMKDVRSNVQIPFFYEEGTVSEEPSDLWQERRYSVGSGIRVVTGSGFVYRLDVGFGDEGTSTTLWIQYPWDDVGT